MWTWPKAREEAEAWRPEKQAGPPAVLRSPSNIPAAVQRLTLFLLCRKRPRVRRHNAAQTSQAGIPVRALA